MENKDTLEPEIAARVLVRRAGLEKAAMEFPQDVADAMKTAAQARAELSALVRGNGAAEPWPPMRMKSTT